MNSYLLDANARLALDVALGTSGAAGDERCGSEHLLFGLVATARGELAELTEIFALDTLRVDRGIQYLRAGSSSVLHDQSVDPPMSVRLDAALKLAPISGLERRSSFDLLVAIISDEGSGACQVLRYLGVRPSDVQRMAELGAASLGRVEVEGLISALDRRAIVHQPWWGPAADAPVAQIPLASKGRVEVARSKTAVATIDGLVTGPDGFGLTVTLTSRAEWILPPVWEMRETLTPGHGSHHRLEPDVVILALRHGSGVTVTNRRHEARFDPRRPQTGSLTLLGSRTSIDRRNDRRSPERRSDSSEWWIWPLPVDGEVFLDVTWPAEGIAGSLRMDLAPLLRHAEHLRGASTS